MAMNLLYLLGVVPDAYRRFCFMFARDVEMFIAKKSGIALMMMGF